MHHVSISDLKNKEVPLYQEDVISRNLSHPAFKEAEVELARMCHMVTSNWKGLWESIWF